MEVIILDVSRVFIYQIDGKDYSGFKECFQKYDKKRKSHISKWFNIMCASIAHNNSFNRECDIISGGFLLLFR